MLSLKIERPESTRHLNMIIYGATGVGKTFLSGTAVDYAPTARTLLVDVEGGAITLYGKAVDIVKPANWRDLQEIYNFLRMENTEYTCVVIDSLTETQRKLSMGTIMGQLDDEAAYPDLESSNAPTRADWLRTGEQMRKFIRAFKDLAYLADELRRLHVIMTALERYDEKRSIVCPQLPGQLGIECGGFVDILGRLSVQKQSVEKDGEVQEVLKRYLLASEYVDDIGTKYLAKNRGGRLGAGVWQPTVKKLIGSWVKETTPEVEDAA